DGAEVVRCGHVRPVELGVLDQVAVETLAVADGRLEADRVFDELEQLRDALRREAALFRDLLEDRLAVQLLREDAAGPPHLWPPPRDVYGGPRAGAHVCQPTAGSPPDPR